MRVVAVAIAVSVTAAIFFFAPEIQRFKELGYFGVFLINLIASASVVIPIPGLGITFISSSVLFWPIVGLASGLGQALGELTGYLAGFGGGAVIEERPLYKRIRYWMEHHGFITLFLLAVTPNPFIDLAGITAGAMKYRLSKFLLAVWLGKTLKSLVFAWAGANSITWITWYWHI